MPDIVITEAMDDTAVAALAREFSVLYDPTLHRVQAMLPSIAADARALVVRNQTQVSQSLIDACPRLQAVARLGVGVDNIDVAACRERGIAVLPATGANDASVAEYVMTGILTLIRGAYGASAAVAKGVWPRNAVIGQEIMGKTLGLVGFGGIARRVARCAAAFGMSIVAHDPFIAPEDPIWAGLGVAPRLLPDLLQEADAVSLHVPLTPATRDLVDAVAISTMKRGAVLINAARGGVVDEAALAAALKEGRLRGAMLDVFATEPLTADNPFHGIPNLILTPHIAGVTEESNRRVAAVIADKLRAVLVERQGR
jgi:(S)-sulfolactate dehydrogenase